MQYKEPQLSKAVGGPRPGGKMWGKELEKEGAACTAGNAHFPMLSDIVKPKMPRA
jgi:hypothetical protein